MSGGGVPEEFGQQRPHTCAVACARYLLHGLGLRFTEKELCDLLKDFETGAEDPEGYSAEQIARLFADKLGLIPRLLCTPPCRGVFSVPDAWLRAGDEGELWRWLVETVARGQAVNVCVDVEILWGLPRSGRVQGHSVVVTQVTDEAVRYLEPHPQPYFDGPQRSELRTAPREVFRAAWQTFGCIALTVERPRP